jgi:hypothetical protein
MVLRAPEFAARLSQWRKSVMPFSSTRRGAEIVGELAKH